MPTTRSLLLFVAASMPLILFPGPSVAFILATALRGGRPAGLAATAGVELGYLVHVLGAVVGISAVIATSAVAFSVVKVLGACWLLWLGWTAWRGGGGRLLVDEPMDASASARRPAFRRGLLVGALNPKTAVFYLAFLPQFVSTGSGPVWSQLLVLGLLFIVMAWVVDAQWALAAGALRRLLPRLRMRVVDRCSAVVYALLATLTLSARRLTST